MRWHSVFQSGRRWFSKTLLVLGCGIVLSACSGEAEKPLRSPVVALVNDRPITVSQLNQVMRGDEHLAATQVIESLVNEELLVQVAEKERVERDPGVSLEIEASRRQILARSFAERHLYSKRQVSADEAHAFYQANPILFEKRKRFLLKDFLFEGTGLDGPLMAALENAHSDADLRALLDKGSITYATQADAISADQLPLDKLGEFEHAAVGDVMTARQSNGKALLMLVTDIQDDAPLSFDRARPYIEAYLTTMRNREALNDYLSRVRTEAKIIYADDSQPRESVSLAAKASEVVR